MKEQQKHVAAYEFYRDMQKRSYLAVASKCTVSLTSIKKWAKAFNWQERVMLHDQEVQKGVQEKMMPEWIDAKAYLLKVALEQVKRGRNEGVVPVSTRDMMAASKEARSIMGETDKVEVTGSVDVALKETLQEYESVIKRISASNPVEDTP